MSNEIPDYQTTNFRDTPNKRFIDEWLAGMYHQYRYEDLTEFDRRELYNIEYEIRHKFEQFKMTFPPEAGLQGEMRAFVLDNQNEDREALTPRERERLRLAEKDLRKRVKRARGTAKDSERDDRKVSLESINRNLRSMLELLKELLKVWG